MLLALVLSAAAAAPAPPAPASTPARITSMAKAAMQTYHLKGLIVQVRRNGRNVYTRAFGDSMTGVPATPQMHFRNGAMAFTYMSTLLLEMADRHRLSLDDKLSKYRPDLPHAGRITLRNLANMTSGYADYVYQPEILHGINRNPFHFYTSEDLIRIGVSKPMMFAPGTNWGYSHTNYVILGTVLAKVTGMPLAAAIERYVLEPMGLSQTRAYDTPQIPEPVLHAFSSERREDLRIPADVAFYEDATFWNPSWTTANGAVEITDITDMSKSMEETGTGKLLSKRAFEAQVGASLAGFGHAAAGCAACRANSNGFNYGLGVVNLGPWVTQTKNFAGSGATSGYLRTQGVTISVVTTYRPAAFDAHGNYKNASEAIFTSLAGAIAPGTLPPLP